MELGPGAPIRECPTCGVDAARAMVVAAVVAFYHPDYECPRCSVTLLSMQRAADHMATHESNVVEFVRDWVTHTAESNHLRITRE